MDDPAFGMENLTHWLREGAGNGWMGLMPRRAIIEPEEDEEPVLRPMIALDDAQVVHEYLKGERRATARVELEHRRRFENMWSGGWSAGPHQPVECMPVQGPIPSHLNRPRKRKDSMSGDLAQRAEMRKLFAKARNGHPTERAATKHILKTKFNKSVS